MMHLRQSAKIFLSRIDLSEKIKLWKSEGKSIVFTNGCFDILHPGHVDYLNRAKDLGDYLVMGINTDQSVSRLKGEHRPIQKEDARLQVLAGLQSVDALVLFDEETPLELINMLTPNVLVKGGDYTIETIVGATEVLAHGGRVEIIPFLKGYSTSAIEKRILLGNQK